MRSNGFRQVGDAWVRQNLTAGGLFDLQVRPMGNGQYDLTLRQGTTKRAGLTRDLDGVIDIVTAFLLS